MTYVDDAKKINCRYDDEVLKRLSQVKDNYQDAIDLLNSVVGVEDCNTLKNKLIDKKSEIESQMKNIQKLKGTLLSNARKKDKEEADKKAAEKTQ